MEITDAAGLIDRKIVLKSGLEGRLKGIYRDEPGGPVQFIADYWSGDGEKKSHWFNLSDFSLVKED